MAVNTGMASPPFDIRRARFSWCFNTPGRRRWLVVQFVSAPREMVFGVEQDATRYAPPRTEARSLAQLLDGYTGEIWRRRSY